MKGSIVKSIASGDLEHIDIPDIDIDKQKEIEKMIIKSNKEYEEIIRHAEYRLNEQKNTINRIMNI